MRVGEFSSTAPATSTVRGVLEGMFPVNTEVLPFSNVNANEPRPRTVRATLAGKLIAEAIAGEAESFDLFGKIPTPNFPGGDLLRWPGMVLGMSYYALRDRL